MTQPHVYKDLTSELIRFSEKFFTNGRSDENHNPSIKSCLVRVPGTINSKNGDKVRIIQRWDGKNPNIRWILSDFRQYLIQKRIEVINERLKKKKRNGSKTNNVIGRRNNKNSSNIHFHILFSSTSPLKRCLVCSSQKVYRKRM